MRKTLMIEKVPKYMCKEIELKRHFSEAYPDVSITKINLAYDVQKLQLIYNDLKDAKMAWKYCKRQHDLGKAGVATNLPYARAHLAFEFV